MTGFDAELYLRLSGERSLVSTEERNSGNSTLLNYGRALVAVNAVDAKLAQHVVDDYADARRLRTRGHPHHRQRTKQAPAAAMVPRRTVHCNTAIAETWGELRVRSISLSADGVRLAVLVHLAVGPGRRGRSGVTTPPLTVTDEHGSIVSPTFSGGGSPDEWRGHYTCAQTLALDTRWVEILGQRIELIDRASAATVRIEPLPDLDPAERYLTRCLETGQMPGRGWSHLGDAVAALIACGALSPDSAVVTNTHEVAQGLQHGPGPVSPTLPARWRSLLTSRGRAGGPVARLVVGAVTPAFGGVSAAVSELESTDEGFAIEVEIDGAINGAGHFDDSVEQTDLTYTATDDRGNHYLGGLGNWSGGDGGLQGQVEFWPALDPEASQLDLVLSGNLERAVITVALDWDERS